MLRWRAQLSGPEPAGPRAGGNTFYKVDFVSYWAKGAASMESTGVAREPEPLDGCARSNSHLNRGSATAPPTAVSGAEKRVVAIFIGRDGCALSRAAGCS